MEPVKYNQDNEFKKNAAAIPKMMGKADKCIWIVEDDQGIREVISLLLTEEGYTVETFDNASAFREALADGGKLDLLLTDVMLPDGNGLYLCSLVKSALSDNDVPVMVMSAQLDFMQWRRFCRADDFIAKPFNIDEMLKKINRLMT